MKNPQVYSNDKGLHYMVLGPEVRQKVDVDKIIREILKGQFIESKDQELGSAAIESLRNDLAEDVEIPTHQTLSYYSVEGKNVIVSSIPNATSVVSSYDMELLGNISTAMTDNQSEPGCNLI